MTDLPPISRAIRDVDCYSSDQLLPLVYDELRLLARCLLNNENSECSLVATGLVHEAFLRLGNNYELSWENRAHFFGAAAEAMRRILVERARRKKSQKHGGNLKRIDLKDFFSLQENDPNEILALEEVLDDFAAFDLQAAELVKLRVFAGFSIDEAGQLLGMSRATAYRNWKFARAWLINAMSDSKILNCND